VQIWIGAYAAHARPDRRKGDGWLPSLPYLESGDLAAGNAKIDEAARRAGRDPRAIRRMLNFPYGLSADELVQFALEDGVSTFLVMVDDADAIQSFATTSCRRCARVCGTRAAARPWSPSRFRSPATSTRAVADAGRRRG
jgi:hypothetical protein